MSEQLPVGPFAYFEMFVRAEIAAATTAGVEPRSASRDHAAPRARPLAQLAKSLSDLRNAVEWRARADAVQDLFDAAEQDGPRDWLEAVYTVAFEDRDPRVRGTCWLELAMATRDERYMEVLTALTARAFIDRFHAHSEFQGNLGPAARGWVLQLAREFERPDQDKAAATARLTYMNELAGADGSLIDQLKPEDAARFLDHQDAGHRLAALEALSRAGRASSDHQARLLALVRRGAPQDAARLVGDMSEWGRFSEQATSPRDAQLAAHLGKRLREMISSDPDQRVRTRAARTLGQLYWGSSDAHVERVLAQIVLDGSTPDQTRYAAYCALAKVHGLPPSASPLVRAAARSPEAALSAARVLSGEPALDFDWKADIDWALVEECAHSV